ncbi:NgoBV family restriction endonuclease [Dolichospermum compactum]|uniref:NgoBV family restriction endonuclease n=1 Tax=Dolichospermum compactum TaxID=136073 RepID=UPI000BBCB607
MRKSYRCQAKRNVIYNIRPVAWYFARNKYKPFQSRLDFVTALYDTLMQYRITQEDSDNWLEKVKNNYWDHTQVEL